MKIRHSLRSMMMCSIVAGVFFLGCISPSLAQYIQNQIPPSPTTMQLQRYGDYPVSPFTGLVDIKVPIYTIQAGDITVPIYLSFHASGLQWDDVHGTIGPGWTLQCGGQISRSINGLPDDLGLLTTMPDFSTSYQDWGSYDLMSKAYSSKHHDREFDVFTYSFLGNSGKYIPYARNFSDNQHASNFFQIKRDNLRFFDLWTIADEKGLFYTFGGDPGSEEMHSTISPQWPVTSSAVTTWHLSLIRSTKHPGVNVSYHYMQGPLPYVPQRWEFWIDDQFDQGSPGGGSIVPMSSYFPHAYVSGHQNYISPLESRTYHTRLPSGISYPGGRVEFNYNLSNKLQNIKIYNATDELLRTVILNVTDYGSHRRELNSVVFKDAVGVEEECYSFEYNSSAGVGVGRSKDYWGYINAGSYNSNYLPPISYYYSFSNLGTQYHGYVNVGSYNNRNANANAAAGGMIRRMTYPTGGYSEFTYEGHTANNTIQQIGGIRIKSINNYDRGGAFIGGKNYTYNYGKIEIFAEDKLFMEQSLLDLDDYEKGRRTIFKEDPVVSLSPKGAPVTYGMVIETDGEIKTTYSYDNEDAFEYEYLNTPNLYHIPGEQNPVHRLMAHRYKPWNFGNLHSKHIVGPGYERSEGYEYEEFLSSTAHDLLMYQQTYALCGEWLYSCAPEVIEPKIHRVNGSLYNFANRYHYSGGKRLVRKTVTEKGSSGQTTTVREEYKYGDSEYPMRITAKKTMNSAGDSIATAYQYDDNLSKTIAHQNFIYRYHVTSPVTETVTNYTYGQEISRLERIFSPVDRGPSLPAWPQLVEVRTSHGGNPVSSEIHVERYDNQGNILQTRDRRGVVTSYIYGYGNLYPVAQVIGVDYATAIALVNTTLISQLTLGDASMRIALAPLRTGLPRAQVSTYTYRLGAGISSVTDARGYITNYTYDAYQRLIEVRDHHNNLMELKQYHIKY